MPVRLDLLGRDRWRGLITILCLKGVRASLLLRAVASVTLTFLIVGSYLISSSRKPAKLHQLALDRVALDGRSYGNTLEEKFYVSRDSVVKTTHIRPQSKQSSSAVQFKDKSEYVYRLKLISSDSSETLAKPNKELSHTPTEINTMHSDLNKVDKENYIFHEQNTILKNSTYNKARLKDDNSSPLSSHILSHIQPSSTFSNSDSSYKNIHNTQRNSDISNIQKQSGIKALSAEESEKYWLEGRPEKHAIKSSYQRLAGVQGSVQGTGGHSGSNQGGHSGPNHGTVPVRCSSVGHLSEVYMSPRKKFIPGYKNPCWYEKIEEPIDELYRNNGFAQYSKWYEKAFEKLRTKWSQQDKKPVMRLRCLPYFFSCWSAQVRQHRPVQEADGPP